MADNSKDVAAPTGRAVGTDAWSTLFDQDVERNPGAPFTPEMFDRHPVNLSAARRRSTTLSSRRSIKKQWQSAWLVNVIQCIDLTTLAGDDTRERVGRLCAKAKRPLATHILRGLGLNEIPVTTGAVCVYPTMVAHAVQFLSNSGIPVASVATGFPAGLMPFKLRLEEIRYAIDQGASEIDIVISRELVLKGKWSQLYDEVAQMRETCGGVRLKVILATGELKTLRNVYAASMAVMQAGADFIKTSTGKEGVNATMPVSLVMARAIRDYMDVADYRVGFKPAGGLKTSKDALCWQILMKEELGRDWLRPRLFRIGASSLLGDIERQLEYFVTGRYADSSRHALA